MLGFSRIVLLAIALLGGNSARVWSQASAGFEVVGNYRLVGAENVVLQVSAGQGVVRARLEGGGSSDRGAAAPADCVVQAAGALHERTLSATFEPIETDDLSYSATQARAEKRRLIIAFAPGTAEVEQADTYGYCGLGIEFRGLYRKTG